MKLISQRTLISIALADFNFPNLAYGRRVGLEGGEGGDDAGAGHQAVGGRRGRRRRDEAAGDAGILLSNVVLKYCYQKEFK